MSKTKNKIENKVCILCEKEIKRWHKKFIIAIEKPRRLDIYVHRHCFKKFDKNAIKTAVKQHIMAVL